MAAPSRWRWISGREHLFTSKFGCPVCSYSLSELEPRLFSFNSPVGACPSCDGLGQVTVFDPERVVAFPSLSLAAGAVKGWDRRNAYTFSMLESVAKHYGFDIDTPFEQLPAPGPPGAAARLGRGGHRVRLRGAKQQRGQRALALGEALAPLRRHPAELGAALPRDRFGRGARGPGALPGRQALPGLRRRAAAARGAQRLPAAADGDEGEAGEPIYRVEHATLAECLAYFEGLQLRGAKAEIADKIVREIRSRLKFLNDVGLNYLSLDRSADTLSGGEAQRIRLASQIGSGLTGVMYVLDEPSIGLHQRDNERLIGTLKHLRDLGNTVLVVEHDEDMIRAADHVVDMGPGAGVHGGRVIAQGTADAGAGQQRIADRALPGRHAAHRGHRRAAPPPSADDTRAGCASSARAATTCRT